jgi:hypothetical protein
LAKGRDFFVTSIEVRNKQTITYPQLPGQPWTELAIRCCVVLFGIGPGAHILGRQATYAKREMTANGSRASNWCRSQHFRFTPHEST